ncbi:MAG: tetratricopeptide repeat protein [Planctomycetes bacterium]|nr:tetratricopeptide repeat protein [Planctomycetota bacterium]
MRSPLHVAAMIVFSLLLTACATSTTQPDDAGRLARAEKFMAQAHGFKEKGLSDSTLASFGLALEENPNIFEAHMGMADIYRERGNYDLASKSYERATQIDPMSFDANYYLALTRQFMGKVAEAVPAYLQAVAIKPDDFNANLNLGAAFVQLRKPSEAMPYAKRATELRPEHQGAWANFATACTMTGDFTQAIDAYRHAAELGDVSDPIALGLADAHIKVGHYDRAVAVLQGQITRSPSSTAHERLGYVRFKQRRYADALASFRNALKLNPDDTAALNGLGVSLMTLYVQSGQNDNAQRDEALTAWRKSLSLRPKQPRIVDLVARYDRQ